MNFAAPLPLASALVGVQVEQGTQGTRRRALGRRQCPRRRCSPRRWPSGKIQPYPACNVPSASRSSRCEVIHGSALRGVADVRACPRTPYAVSRCHCRPSFLPSVERTPSAMISVRQRRVLRPEGPASTTAATRSPSSSTSTALVPSTMTAPDSTAHRRMASSSSVRGIALPIGGNDVPGHSSSSSWPKPDNRSPLFVVCGPNPLAEAEEIPVRPRRAE